MSGEHKMSDRMIPTCPKCGKRHILVLVADMRIKCIQDAGGCGSTFKLAELFKLYKREGE